MNMAGLAMRLRFGLGVAFGLAWLGFVLFLSTARPKGLVLREAAVAAGRASVPRELHRGLILSIVRGGSCPRSWRFDERICAWRRGDDRRSCGHGLSLLRHGDGTGGYLGAADAV